MRTFTFYSRYIIVLCLLLCATSQIFGQRHFATTQKSGATGLLCLGCVVTEQANAVDANLQTHSTLNVPLGLLAATYQELIFPGGAVAANTPLTIKLGTGDNLLDVTALGGVVITPYNGSVAGTSITAPTLASVASSNNQLEFIFSPTTAYDRVRVTLSGGLLGALSTIYLYDAFYTTPGAAVCNTAYDELHGISSALLGLGLNVGGVANPQNAIDGNINTASTLNAGVGALGAYAQQTIVFQSQSIVGDSVRLTLSLPKTLLDVGILTNIAVSSFNGNTDNNDTQQINGSLLHLRLLDLTNNRQKITVTFAPTKVFDRVQLRLGGIASVLSTLNLNEAEIVLPKPIIKINNVAVTDAAVCAGSTVALAATSNAPGTTFSWYTQLTGGTAVATGASFTTPALTANTTYYVSATRTGCATASDRAAVAVTVSQVPVAPVIANANVAVCPGSTAVFAAQPVTGVTFNWYANPTGGTPLFTGNTYTTAAITATTSFYAEAVAGGTCVSTTRTKVTATLSPLPAVPTLTAPNTTICDGDVAVFAIASPVAGQTYNWYSAATGGTALFTGANFTSPALHANTTYYAEAVNAAGCVSGTRVAATVTVQPKPANPVVLASKTTVAAGQTASISVTNAQAGITYNWYASAAGTTPVFTGNPFVTPALFSTTTYYVAAASSSGCQSATRTAVTINVTIDTNSPCTFANKQTHTANGLCVLCDVSTPDLAIDADTTTASTISIPVGLLGGSNSQTLQFQQPGFAGDTIRFVLQNPGGLADLSLLGGVTVSVQNGGTVVNSYQLNSSLLTLRLLGGTGRYAAYVPTTGNYDRVTVTVNGGAATLLNSLQIYYAVQQYPKPKFNPVAPEICKGSTAALNITSPNPANGTFKWYTTPTGGTAVATGTSFTTPALNANTTYYVEYSRNGACVSPVRTPVQVIVDDIPVKPVVTPSSAAILAGQTATLKATVVNNSTIKWYTSPTGGTPVFTGATFTTPALSANTTYYAEASLGSCVSPDRTAVPVTVTQLVVPTIAVTPPTQSVNTGTTGTITASSTTAGTTFNWYTTPTGGTPIFTGATFVTPPVFANTTYYAEAVVTATGVKSATRAAGVVNVIAVGTDPVACDAATTQTNLVGGVCLLCGIDNEGGSVDNNRNSFSQLHVPIGLLGGYSQQTLTFSNAALAGDSVILDLGIPGSLADVGLLSQINVATYNGTTYNNDRFTVNGSLLHLSLLNGTSHFRVAFKAQAALTKVEIRLNSGVAGLFNALNIYDATLGVAAPVISVANVTACPGSPVTLTATVPANVTVKWYTSATGGTSVFTGAIFVTPALTATTTYYAEASRTATACVQGVRTPAKVTIAPVPTAPVIANANITVCPGSTAVFAAQPVTGVTINWYANPTGGTPLFTGNTYTTAALTATTSFYAEAVAGGTCISTARTKVTATISPLPVVPTLTTPNITICDGDVVVFAIASPVAGQTYNWYSAATGGTVLFTGVNFTSPALHANTTYYAEAVNAAGCVSGTRVAATVTVQPKPANPVVAVNNSTITAGQTASISVTNTQTGITYKWYASAAGTTPVFTGNPFVTPALFSTTTYYVEAVNATGCQSAARTAVTINVTIDNNSPCTFANQQTSAKNGLCLLCDITNGALAADADTTTASTISVPIGLLGGNASQTLQFQQPGFKGDTIKLVFKSPVGLADVSLLGSISVSVYNGGTLVGNYPLSSSLLTLKLLAAGNRYAVYVPAVGNYDRVQITLNSGAATLLTSLQVYYAVQQYPKPVFNPVAPEICKGSTAALNITSPNPANGTFKWYTTPTGGTAVATGTSFTTPALNANTTYYVEYSRNGACVSPVRTPVQVIVNDPPAKPVVTPPNATIIAGQTATFKATVVNNATIKWYTTPTGGTPVFTGPTFTTPALSVNTTYYAEAVLGNCVSPDRTVVSVTVTPVVIPDVSVTPPTQTVNVGTPGTLTASSTTPGTTFNWYTTPTGGTPVFTGATFETPPVFAATTYYAEAVVTATGVKSATRASGIVNVNAVGSDPVPCDAAIAQTNGANGICLLCGVSNVGGSVDNNRNTFSQIHVPIGLLGGSAQQTLAFANTGIAGDSVTVELGIPGSLADVGLLSQINVATYNGTTYNGDRFTVNGSLLSIKLLNGTSRFKVTFKAAHTFNKVEIQFNSGVAGLLNAVNVYDAYQSVAAPTISVPNVTACQGSTATLTATVPANVTVKWYTTATGGTAVFTGATFVTPVLTANKTYYAEASRTVDGCAQSVRTPATVTITPAPAAPVVAVPTTTVCVGQPATFTAQAVSGVTFNWFAAATGGTSLFTGAQFTTPALTATTSYYVEAVGAGNCGNSTRTKVTANVTASPTVPVVAQTPVQTCSGSAAVLSATSTQSGITFNWYTTATGGTPVFTGPQFITPALTASTSYYVEAASTGGCTSSTRAKADVSVNPTPVAPTIAISPAGGQITSGQTATLTASSTTAGVTFKWYSSASGGTSIFTGNVFKTPALTSNTTYYVEASTAAGCISTTRTSVNIIVNPVFNTLCDFASTQTFDVNGGLLCVGCAVNTPNNSVDQDTTNFSQLSVPIGLLGSNVSQKLIFSDAGVVGDTVTVKISVPASLATVGVLNQLQIASFNGATYNNDRINLSSSLLKITLLSGGQTALVKFAPKTAFDRIEIRFNGAVASLFNTLNIYYASKQVATPVLAAKAVNICSGSTASFAVSNARAGVTYKWYTSATGGTLVHTGSTFTTAALTATTTYYVESSRTSTGCANPNRASATANVTAGPVNPVLAQGSVQTCSGSPAVLTVSPTQAGVVYNWYAAATGGTPVFTGAQFTTPVLTTNTSYYVEAAANGCVSPARTKADVVVNPTPVAPTVAVNPAGGQITTGGTATLTASSTTAGAIFKWYTTPTGGVAVATGKVFITPALTATTTYYAESSLPSGCVSPQRTPVILTVTPPIIIPDVAVNPSTQTVNAGTPGTLNATSTTPGAVFNWFTTPTGGQSIFTGATFVSPGLFTATTYYAESSIPATGVKSTTRASGIVNVSAIGTDPVPCDAAIAQTNGANGICLLCGVSNPDGAIDNNRNSFSQIHVPVGLLGGSDQQTLRFANTGIAGDSITVELGIPGSLADVGLLSQINVATYNGSTYNGDRFTVNGSLLKITILNGTSRFRVVFKAAHTFDRVQIQFNSGVAGLLNAVNVYDAYQSVAAPVISATGPTVCQGSPATLTATVPANVTVKWYTTSTGGTPVFTGATYPIPAVNATTTYYAEASRTASGCPQAVRTPVTVTVTPAPAAPVVAAPNQTVCSGQPATFTAQAVAGVTFNWYTTATGGTPVFTSTSNTFTTPLLTATTSYYVEATAGTCGSSTRTKVTATVTATPLVPVVSQTPVSTCSGTSATLSVASPLQGVTYNWYTAATGGTPVFTGATFHTPDLTANTSYYVEAAAGGCTSSTRAKADVIVNPTPGAPVVVANTPGGQITSGQKAILTVTPTTPGITYNWYTSATGGTSIFTGASFTTPALTSTTIYYVEAVATAGGCTSVVRTPVTVIVNPIFNTLCDFASTQTFDVSGVCVACTVSTPNNAVDQDTTNFSQLHMPISALGSFVNQKLIFTDAGVVGDTVTLKLSIPASLTDVGVLSSIQLASYNGTTYNGDRINLSSSLLKITILSGGQTAIVKFAPKAGFDRVEVRLNSGLATLFTTLNLYYASKQVEAPIVAQPTTVNICAGGTATFTVSNVRAGVTYKWYTAAVGGTLVHTGATFPVKNVTATTTYYVESSRTSTGCANPNRVGATVNVTPLPQNPQLDNAARTICAGELVTFTITNIQAGVTYNWYTSQTGGAPVFTGPIFKTSPVSDIIYFVEAVNGTTCTSPARTVATVKVNQVPSKPSVQSPNESVCAGSPATLTVLNPEAGVTYNWYTVATGGAAVHTGVTFITPAITQNITYYIEATNATSCINNGGRTAVSVTPDGLPIAPTLSAAQNPVCNGGTTIINVTNQVAGVTYNWYTDPTGGKLLHTGTSYTTPALTADISYYVEAVSAATCSSATRTKIDIKVLAIPSTPVLQTPAGGYSVCSGLSATLTISNPQPGLIYNWYDVATGGTPVFTSSSPIFVTPALTANITYYVEATVTGNCNASARAAVPVTVNPLPNAPVLTVANPTACLGSPVTLTIKTPQPGVVYNWYTAATGGAPVSTKTSYTTPPILATTDFYVEAINSNGCGNAGGRIKIEVNIEPVPPAPVIANGASTPTCVGSSATLNIDNPQVLLTYKWYTTATGGTALASGVTFQTPVLTADATYYAEAVNSAGCTSSSRTRVDVVAKALPNGPTVTAQGGTLAICAGSPAVLTASSTTAGVTISTYNWYTTATGGTPVATGATFNTPPVTAAITYYVEAVSDAGCASSVRTPVPLTIDNSTAPQPTVDASGSTTCQNSSATIHVTNPVPGMVYNWYTVANGGTSISTGPDFTTPALTAATTYYVEATNSQSCNPSTRLAVKVDVTAQPATPTVKAATVPVCLGSPATLSVQSPQAGITYNWYDSPTKNNLVFTGPDFPTGPVNANATYYVEAANGSCSSSSLASVQVNAIPAPGAPDVQNNNSGINACQGGTAVLSVLNPQPNFTYNWYSSASGGTPLSTGNQFTTPVLTATTIYFVEAVNENSCPSATRTPVTVTVTGAPVAPQASTQGTAICPGTTTTLMATSGTPGAVIKWYASATGGTALATGTSFTTPALTANTTYYAEAETTAGGCVSTTRTPVTVTMLSPLAAPVATVSTTTTESVTFMWNAVTGATAYEVSLDNGQHFIVPSSGATGLTHVVTGLQPGQTATIIVRAKGKTDCELSANSAAVTGTASNPFGNGIFIPNVFTPNGDGNNDLLLVYGNTIKSLKLSIYDQWGELQFQTTNKASGWDGTYKGTKQPVGVYVYYVEATLNDGQVVKKKGTVTLLR